jgi:hypothetical protein
MSGDRLPEIDVEIGRVSRLVRAAVRVTLAAVALLLVVAAVAVARVGLDASLRAVGDLFGGGG